MLNDLMELVGAGVLAVGAFILFLVIYIVTQVRKAFLPKKEYLVTYYYGKGQSKVLLGSETITATSYRSAIRKAGKIVTKGGSFTVAENA